MNNETADFADYLAYIKQYLSNSAIETDIDYIEDCYSLGISAEKCVDVLVSSYKRRV
jgi:hypothetical protein